MHEKMIRERIAQLRTQKGVSVRDMSLSLGQNESYINKIENGKALPSLQGLLYICDYFGITPQTFFDFNNANPQQFDALMATLKKLDASTLKHLSAIADKLAGG